MADTNAKFQVISNAGTEDACIEAQTSGPRDVALREAMHYAELYAEDWPMSVVEHIEVARLGYPSGNYGPTTTPPADAALADALEHAGTRAEFHPDSEIAVLCRQAAAALRARAVPEGWSLAAHPDGGIVVQHRTLGGCFVTEKENQPREIPGQILFYLASDMLAASKSGDGGAG